MISSEKAEIETFAELSRKWVVEIDDNPLKEDIEEITEKFRFIDHCWIKSEDEIIGVVRINYDNFYSLGNNPEYDEYIEEILLLIEKDIANWKPHKIKATVNEKYKNYLINLGYKIEFNREKLSLDFKNAQGLEEIENLKFDNLKWKHFYKIVDLFIDAYEGTIDEQIGMFTKDNAVRAIEMIKNSDFGRVMKNLSFFVPNDNDEYIAGAITTINEQTIFLVIIGVRKNLHRTGLGKKLISAIVKGGIKKGYGSINLWVTSENNIARNLYYSMGFEKVIGITNAYKELI
jgi:ribosomal protein S18 acetylase RimI-like enzyme